MTMKIVAQGIDDLGDANGARLSKCRTRRSCDHGGLSEPSNHMKGIPNSVNVVTRISVHQAPFD